MAAEKELLFSAFPNYTEEMYEGNAPAGIGLALVGGGFSDRWECKWGSGETNGDDIIYARFFLNPKVSITIIGNSLHVLDIRHWGKPDFWEHCVNSSGMPGLPCCSERSRHVLEAKRLEKYLNTPIPDCKFWLLVQRRAKELCGMSAE